LFDVNSSVLVEGKVGVVEGEQQDESSEEEGKTIYGRLKSTKRKEKGGKWRGRKKRGKIKGVVILRTKEKKRKKRIGTDTKR